MRVTLHDLINFLGGRNIEVKVVNGCVSQLLTLSKGEKTPL
jgi:hypothetical protein